MGGKKKKEKTEAKGERARWGYGKLCINCSHSVSAASAAGCTRASLLVLIVHAEVEVRFMPQFFKVGHVVEVCPLPIAHCTARTGDGEQ